MKENEGSKTHPSAVLPPTWREAISTLLKEFRVAQGWTQEELGFRSGYDPVYVNMLERGRRNPSVQALINLCQVFKVRPSVFFAEVERRLEPTSNAGGGS